MTIDKTLTVDLNRVQPHKIIKIHEGDENSVFLVLTVTKDGAAVSLSGLTIKYDATIAGFLAEQNANGSVSAGNIRIPITKNMTALPGTLKIDIKMISGTQILYTQTVTMIVEKAVVDEGTIIDFDGTTIGGRLKALEDGLDVVEGKFPIHKEDIAANQVIKVQSISNDDATVNAAVDNYTAYSVLLEGRSNLMICVNSGTNLRAQVRFDTLGYMKYRSQTKHDGVWDDWTAWAPIASNMNMANGAVSTAKIADSAVTADKLASNAVTSSKIADNAVTTDKLASNAVTAAKIATGAIHSQHLSDGAVDTDAIETGAVTSNEIANGAVTTDKLASKAVTGAKIGDRAVGTGQIALLAVTEGTLGTGAVTELKLADNAVTTSKIKDANISSQKLMNLIISTAKIIDGAVTTAKIADGSVTTAKLADDAVTSDKIADGAVTVDKIPSEEITDDKLAPGCVTTAKIEFNAVTADEIANGSITTSKLATQAVTSGKIADGAVTATKIASGVVPTKTSDLQNDSGFLTQHQDISGKADKATTLAGYGITNAYRKDEIDGVFMELAPNTNPGSISTLEDGQLFRCQGAVALKTGNASDYIELAKKSIVPTKTSDLTNDSGFLTAHQDISDLMKYAPTVNTSQEVNALHAGQLFVYQGEVCIKTTDDYIHLAKMSQVPVRTSQLTNDSGFVNDLSGYMKLAHTTTSEDSGQFYLERVGLSWSAVNLYLALYNSDPKRVAWYSDLPDISGKANIETGTIASNHAWYTDESQGYTLTGNYTIIGDTCFVHGTAKCISGWERVYYSLPVACLASSTTIALAGNNSYSIATGSINNISVMEIKQMGSQYMGSDTIQFTLIYKCQ